MQQAALMQRQRGRFNLWDFPDLRSRNKLRSNRKLALKFPR